MSRRRAPRAERRTAAAPSMPPAAVLRIVDVVWPPVPDEHLERPVSDLEFCGLAADQATRMLEQLWVLRLDSIADLLRLPVAEWYRRPDLGHGRLRLLLDALPQLAQADARRAAIEAEIWARAAWVRKHGLPGQPPRT